LSRLVRICEIRTVSAIRALWTVSGWRFILGCRRVLQDVLAGFRWVFRGESCVKTQKNFHADNGWGVILLTCYMSADMLGSGAVRAKLC
jgi:hypothetical protein